MSQFTQHVVSAVHVVQEGYLSYPRTETDEFDPGYSLQVTHLSEKYVDVKYSIHVLSTD